MFNALREQKTSDFQLQILKNRLWKLDREEQKARDKIEKAQRRVRQLEDWKVRARVIDRNTK
jgi:prefoldin subunit 5